MPDVVKDLNYYLEHPDEMPTDPAEIEKITNSTDLESIGKVSEGTTDTDPDADAEAQAEAKRAEAEAAAKAEAEKKAAEAAAAAGKATEGEPKPEGVLAKDGKHVLPFEVLEKTRARNLELETLSAQQAERIKELTEGKGKPAGEGDDAALLSEEDLAAVEEDTPTLGRVLRAQQAQIRRFMDREAAEAKRLEEEQATQRKTIEQQLEDAKNANPKLLEWETSNPVRYDRAVEIDAALRHDPEWKDKSFTERFAEVVLRTQRHFGDRIEQPAAGATPGQGLKERADQAVKAAGEAEPGTLSDLPGGAPPAVSELSTAHPADIARAFEGMSDAQIMQALGKVA